MTEKQWLGLTTKKLRDRTAAEKMLAHMQPLGSERKFRLLLCATLRLEAFVTEANGRASVEMGERWADGEVTADEVKAFSRATLGDPGPEWTALAAPATRSIAVAIRSNSNMAKNFGPLFREVFGNPFRPVALDPNWLTTDVLALARGIYDEKAFDRMPILADALQDAGCTNDEVLSHCRDTSARHVRGCWVLDLLLEKGS